MKGKITITIVDGNINVEMGESKDKPVEADAVELFGLGELIAWNFRVKAIKQMSAPKEEELK